jgi:hypothetical protein
MKPSFSRGHSHANAAELQRDIYPWYRRKRRDPAASMAQLITPVTEEGVG